MQLVARAAGAGAREHDPPGVHRLGDVVAGALRAEERGELGA